ncbi:MULTISPECIES: DNA methyltransferase [Thermus]|jgi:DNA modification methylase|uniref:Modification methylase n=1 Tax=Thermus brockianus TaxID=56956 RepID=A0A1J0LXK8_THEBO|nr:MULTISPECIES: DNA methyltransferase [Thermus]APD10199.1 modification methylase [Thermus brockianus]
MEKRLYFGDNLEVLRKHIPDESVDLIYLDPPFNSKADYNVIFREHTGKGPGAQIKAFEDTWSWGMESEQALQEVVAKHGRLGEFLDFLVRFLGKNDLSAYLVMMAVRLLELHRVLKPTGSLYLHCDPTASHYLKVILDQIFGPKNFRNEVVWKRTSAHSSAKRWGPVHDTLLFYTKGEEYTWNVVYENYEERYMEDEYDYQDAKGRYALKDLTGAGASKGDSGKPWRGIDPGVKNRHWAVPSKDKLPSWLTPPDDWDDLPVQERLDFLDREGLIYWPSRGVMPRFKKYLDTAKGVPIRDVVTDIPPLGHHSKERLGYPTQKPLVLLERIIQASSNPGDVVLDPFCGCGTALAAAEKLGRRWIGIDITHLAITLIQARLRRDFGLEPGRDYEVLGTPKDVESARFLFEKDPHQFQLWALGLIGAQPYGDPQKGKKGKDTGIDGFLYFRTPDGGRLEKVVVQVKGGKRLGPSVVRDLRGVMEREKAAFGVLIVLEAPTQGMREEAAKAGVYSWGSQSYPRLQILTVEELLAGKRPEFPAGSLNVSYERKEVRTARPKGGMEPLL